MTGQIAVPDRRVRPDSEAVGRPARTALTELVAFHAGFNFSGAALTAVFMPDPVCLQAFPDQWAIFGDLLRV